MPSGSRTSPTSELPRVSSSKMHATTTTTNTSSTGTVRDGLWRRCRSISILSLTNDVKMEEQPSPSKRKSSSYSSSSYSATKGKKKAAAHSKKNSSSSSSSSAAKNPDRAPRPPNAYICYRSERMREQRTGRYSPEVAAAAAGTDVLAHVVAFPTNTAGTNCSQAQLSKTIGSMWRSEKAEVQCFFYELARARLEEHKRLYPDYKFRPTVTQKAKDARIARRGKKLPALSAAHKAKAEGRSPASASAKKSAPASKRQLSPEPSSDEDQEDQHDHHYSQQRDASPAMTAPPSPTLADLPSSRISRPLAMPYEHSRSMSFASTCPSTSPMSFRTSHEIDFFGSDASSTRSNDGLASPSLHSVLSDDEEPCPAMLPSASTFSDASAASSSSSWEEIQLPESEFAFELERHGLASLVDHAKQGSAIGIGGGAGVGSSWLEHCASSAAPASLGLAAWL